MNELTIGEFILGSAIGMWPVTILVIIMTIGLAICEWRDEREAKKHRRNNINGMFIVSDMTRRDNNDSW